MNNSEKKWLIIGVPTILIVVGCFLAYIVFFGKIGNGAGNVSENESEVASEEKGDGGIFITEEAVDTIETQSKSTSTTVNTGNLTETGSGYEGIKGTGNYNYGEALQKSLLFYELQRSGDLPENTRCNWRGDSALNDGKDNGLDLSGGYYDAGDNVKFNLPMSYTASMLGWSIYENKEAYEESGQLEYALGNIKWANDYFIKCHPDDNTYYYQVGNGSSDHSWWGPCEVIEYRMDRPSYAVTKDNPGSTVCGETAASLAICSLVYKNIDKSYSEECLKHAKSLYDFAKTSASDSGYTMAAGFYDSWSGFNDELAWSGAWLYLATDDKAYLEDAKKYYESASQDYDWAMCWDDVHIGAAVMLSKLTGDKKYSDAVEQHLDFWLNDITYTPKGLAWLDSWGSLRYATTTGYIAAIYSKTDACPSDKKDKYWDFAVAQADYALGSSGRSFMIGYGEDSPVNPHHRTAQGSYCDNMNEPAVARHTLYGALVGGPDASDGYTDEVSNYTTNEVACDYNAGFTGLLAELYSKYHGETLKDFGAVEEVEGNEIYVDGAVNVNGEDFVEIKAYVYNTSAWPARCPDNLELRYFMDLSEVYAEGKDATAITVTTNYMQGGTADGIKCFDEDNHIYYLSVDFSDSPIYPGGQEQYKKEIQVRISNPGGAFDNTNDPSFASLDGSNVVNATTFALYEGDELCYGTEPPKGKGASQPVNVKSKADSDKKNAEADSKQNSSTKVSGGSIEGDKLTVKADYSGMQNNQSSITGTIDITNNSGKAYALNDLNIMYYLTNGEEKSLQFSCYHSAINGENGSYSGVNGCSGKFTIYDGNDADTVCTMSFADKTELENGDTLTVNFCINADDWSNMSTADDYSLSDISHIVVKTGNTVLFGEEP